MSGLLRVTREELTGHFDHVLKGLFQGKPFVLLEPDHPLAQVMALPAAQPPAPAESFPSTPQICQLETCLYFLSETTVSRIAGLTLPSLQRLRATGLAPAAVQQRLHRLTEALNVQASTKSRASIQAWWRMRQPELGGLSPSDHLARPWTPGDPRSDLVFHLIERHHLICRARPRQGAS